MNKDYYKAYDKRYKQVYENNMLWEISKPTNEVLDTIKKYNINKDNKILDLGCGEGRDAINLLNKGYNVLAVDYSNTVINKCNELTNNKYINNFKQFDLLVDKMDIKFDFIYSVAVIHMFLNNDHRKNFYRFIYDHLNYNGYALIISMGDGIKEYKSNSEDAFNNTKRININTNKEITVVKTSCNIKNKDNLIKEIESNNLKIISLEIINDVPNFNKCISIVLKKVGNINEENECNSNI